MNIKNKTMNLRNIIKLSNLYYSLANDESIKELKVSDRKVIKTIQEISDSLDKDKKIIISYKPIDSFQGKFVSQETKDKPNGLWYSLGNEWIEFVIGESYYPFHPGTENEYKYIYEIELNEEDIRKISDIKALERFSIANQAPPRKKISDPEGIDWNHVAESYYGIEISPYIIEARFSENKFLGWYYTWDIASGCIWHKRGLKNIKLIAKKIEGTDTWEVFE